MLSPKLHPDYLFLRLGSVYSSRYISFTEQIDPGTFQQWRAASSRRIQAGRSRTRYLTFPLPPLAEQHRIVAKVDALMALCDRLEYLTAAAG